MALHRHGAFENLMLDCNTVYDDVLHELIHVHLLKQGKIFGIAHIDF